MKKEYKLINHSEKYISKSVMLPTIWVKGQSKKFDYVDIEILPKKLIITPNFDKKVPTKTKK